MAANPTPDDDDVLCALAEDMADGCHKHEVAIDIKQNTEAKMRAALAAVTTAKAAAGAAKNLPETRHAERRAADAAGTEVLGNCRLRLAKLFGNRFSPQWEEAGFPDGSTAVPNSQDKRFALLAALKNYFHNHPASESADMEATEAVCTAAHAALSAARKALNGAKGAQSTALADGKAAAKALRKRVRGLIDELDLLLAKDDVRYLDFGLNIPANPTAPLEIADLTLTAIGDRKALAEWSYAVRMEGSRVMIKTDAPDAKFQSAGTTVGLEMLLKDLMPGSTLFVQVIPYNAAGDGGASPVRSVVVA